MTDGISGCVRGAGGRRVLTNACLAVPVAGPNRVKPCLGEPLPGSATPAMTALPTLGLLLLLLHTRLVRAASTLP